jgi:hypothetical protein
MSPPLTADPYGLRLAALPGKGRADPGIARDEHCAIAAVAWVATDASSELSLWRWVAGRGGKGTVYSLNIALSAWFCPFAELCGGSRSHTGEEIVGITLGMLGRLY